MFNCPPMMSHLFAVLLLIPAGAAVSYGQGGDHPQTKHEFLKLCDSACEEFKVPVRAGVPFFRESYVIRALAVAYDMTGKAEYLDACRAWTERMIEFQEKMTPPGAYYMNYARKPGETKGDWYVADSASIGLGVLATAVRCKDRAQRDRYLGSARSFAKLVMENYTRASGGITDGIWPESDREWWCSTGVFTSLAFLLYQETGEEAYRNAALRGLDWLNDMDFKTAGPFDFKMMPATIVMYVFEGYSATCARPSASTAPPPITARRAITTVTGTAATGCRRPIAPTATGSAITTTTVCPRRRAATTTPASTTTWC